ncbi:homeobox-DDT domain protein RLT2-like isoform X1 [Zingiber officinale]|uniref:homeobox-DDT domain protein RLT2-like isoform X1 n=1 Tax=Zingiber officinale TaxID=94328 RepID=UPI001C4D3366|nr:homeobox-DDT domain protein RLT2-like isoform X1 [Zingiber officinale]
MESGEGAEEKEQSEPQPQPQPTAEAWKKPAPEGGEKPSKRKMKTPYQLEILEKTYAVETYPTEIQRTELSVKTGLSDRQLQMWFCHRRLKDRKFPPTKRQRREEDPLPLTPPPPVLPPQNDRLSSESGGVGLSSSPFSGGLGSSGESRRPFSRAAPVVSRIGADMSAIGRRYYDMGLPPPPPAQPTMAEMRMLASVESQLGEPLRQDGPVLGVEFDPLPPGAFGAPIAEMPVQQKQPLRPYDGNMFERYDTKPMKATADHLLASSSNGKRKLAASASHMSHPQMSHRALHEYQFLPEQLSVRSETYDRVSQSHYYDSSLDASSARAISLPKKLHANEQGVPNYTFQGQMSSANLLSQPGRQQNFPSISMDSDGPPHSDMFPISASDTQFGMHQVGLENQSISSDRRSARDDDFSRLERKRKSDEARIAKEVEAHEKRIRKELEKQDILRRKREEQMRREMERHDRERRKEEERMLREKLREEERFEREQRRENERREKFLLKESRRAEKLRQKEELRREKDAARQKAATERATARRIAREYMELIEDERLELMEIAAINKGFSSIFGLDSDTLQQLDSFRTFAAGMLQAFPPSSVKLGRPFGVQPWVDSDENIANVLMVWKFLITFADILGLWPFTLDEFVQSLHDYGSRLLGEIHVSLLKSIIKDIEDVARTPAITVGASQSSSANPGGGHPQIVEGAYAWGFNIRSWQRHLNCLTWPEILRQFALSAGFGPQLKKKNVEHTYLRDDNEGIDGEDVISTLRNGSAVENAVALMHERGYTHRRRSRHRLTPGTVKFAAFHVLSLEGSRGLTILEVADKIQKSGLRDLTTSKTPEASIAAALSRDTKLFERTAPSTYCVRSPYRKDPVDADAVLSAAREKIHVFQSALSDSEEVEKDTEDVDDAERDEDSEGDAGDDHGVDDTGTDHNLDKNDPFENKLNDPSALTSVGKMKGGREIGATPQISFGNVAKVCPKPSSENANTSGATEFIETNSKFHEAANVDMEETEMDESNFGEPWVEGLAEVGKMKGGREIGATPQTSFGNVEKVSRKPSAENANTSGATEFIETNSKFHEAANVDMETEIDESSFGEPWVQGLAEGDYSGLSVEERLNALVALIGVAIEGNSIRIVLEERLEAATALKKQMWAEAQLDKRRFKEEYSSRLQGTFGGYKAEIAQMNGTREGSQTPQDNVDKVNDGNLEVINSEHFLEQNQVNMGYNSMGQELTNSDVLSIQQCGYAAEKSRSQLKSFIGHKAELLYVYRSLPLGQDRRRNRYWLFSTSSSPNDPGSGRIFLESKEGHWTLIDSEEAFDTLLAALDTRGIRESHLHSMLQRIETTYKEAIKRRKDLIISATSSGDHAKPRASRMVSGSDCSMEIDSPSLCRLTPDALENSTSLKIELGSNEVEKNSALVRYQGFLRWMWNECYNSQILCTMKYGTKRCPELLHTCDCCFQSFLAEEKHCPSCHKTFKTFQNSDALFSEHVTLCEQKRKLDPDWKLQLSNSTLPMGIRLLKTLLSMTEAVIPAEALQTLWTEGYRKSWAVKLHSSSSAGELFQVLTLLERAVKLDFLLSSFETTTEPLISKQETASAISAQSGLVPVLPWVPYTSAAVALRLLDLDFSISYMLNQKLESRKEKEGHYIKLPSHYAAVNNMQEVDPMGTPEQVDYLTEGRWLDSGSGQRGRGRGSRGRGGRGRGRGRGLRGSASSSRANFMTENLSIFDKATRKFTRRGRTRGRGGRRRGRRTIRPRQISDGRVSTINKRSLLGSLITANSNSKQAMIADSPQSSGGDEWGIAQVRKPYVEDDDISRGSESDDNGQASGDDYDDQAADSLVEYDYSKSIGLADDGSEDVGDMDMDEDVEEDDMDGRSHDLDAYMDDDDDDLQDNPDDVEDGEGNRDEDEGATSYSSQYSD